MAADASACVAWTFPSCSETMLDQYTESTKGPAGEPGVVIAHVEANVHLHRTLSKIREAGGSPSVALNPHTPAEMIENVLDLVDHVLVMTVNPGFGGQAYIPTSERARSPSNRDAPHDSAGSGHP